MTVFHDKVWSVRDKAIILHMIDDMICWTSTVFVKKL